MVTTELHSHYKGVVLGFALSIEDKQFSIGFIFWTLTFNIV